MEPARLLSLRAKEHSLQATTLTCFSVGWGKRHVFPGLGWVGAPFVGNSEE